MTLGHEKPDAYRFSISYVLGARGYRVEEESEPYGEQKSDFDFDFDLDLDFDGAEAQP